MSNKQGLYQIQKSSSIIYCLDFLFYLVPDKEFTLNFICFFLFAFVIINIGDDIVIKPEKLKKGDKIAVVSLSSGLLGEKSLIHKYHIAKERLEKDFGLEVIPMPNALKGIDYLYEHPEARAEDLMAAFEDNSIKAIICAIGGTDAIRLLPYINYDTIKNNPKIFMGYSDTTVNHFMMQKANLVSFYGPSIMCEFGEYVKMFDYTKDAFLHLLFEDCENYEIKSSPYWSKDFVPWSIENIHIEKKVTKEEHGYETLQGSGIVTGPVIGGCIDVFPKINGTEIWPEKEIWKDKILFLETSDDKPKPEELMTYLRDLGEQGIFDEIQGVLIGKPYGEEYYEEYKEIYKTVLKEFQCETLPVLYNINMGHAYPIGILPLGTNIRIDFDHKTITLVESPTSIIQKRI